MAWANRSFQSARQLGSPLIGWYPEALNPRDPSTTCEGCGLADMIAIAGRDHYPQDIEATVAEASSMVRRGYVTAFAVPAGPAAATDQRLVIIAERAAGTSREDPEPAIEAIRTTVARRHGVDVSEVRFLPAGAIPRTTSGKLARRACRAQYLAGSLGSH